MDRRRGRYDVSALLIAAPVQAQGKSIDFTKEPACDSLTPTSMGGPAPNYMPTHHDEVAAGRFDTPMEPLFLRMRDELPQVHPISPLYREPICFDTQTKAVFIGESARDPRPGATK